MKSRAFSEDNPLYYGTGSIDKLLHGKSLFEKTKDEEKEKMLLDTRQPFMNRMGLAHRLANPLIL